MYNLFGIKTIELSDGIKASYFISPKRDDIIVSIGAHDITQYLPEYCLDMDVKAEIEAAWNLIKNHEIELAESIISNSEEPLLCPYSLYIFNDDVTSAEYVQRDILQTVLNHNEDDAAAITQKIHESTKVKVKTYPSYEMAHLYLNIIESVNLQTKNTLAVDIEPDWSKNFKNLYDIMEDDGYV